MERNKEYDVMRGILTLLVVAGHSCYTVLQYGSMNVIYPAPSTHVLAWEIIWKIQNWIYSFHMPAFFALSGAIFFITHTHYKSIETLIISKAKHLLVPLFLCGILYTIPVKTWGGGYDVKAIGNAIHGVLFALGDAGHLWFLPTLFFCFCITGIAIYSKLTEQRKILVLCFVLPILYIHFKKENFLIPYLSFEYLLWFGIGYVFEFYRENVKKISVPKVIGVALLLCWYPAYRLLPGGSEIVTCLGVFNIYYVSTLLQKYNIKPLKWITKNSFDIYLYHDPLNVVILKLIDVLTLYYLYVTWYGSIALIVIRIVVPIFLSVFIGKLQKKVCSIKM